MKSDTPYAGSIFKIFGNKLIDYAGTFPPASLDLKTSFTNYLKYQDTPESWMLSRYVIPAKRLSELASIIEREKIIPNKPLNFSVLGGKEVAISKFFDGLVADIEEILKFKTKFGDNIITETYEVLLPLELLVVPDMNKLVDFFTKVSVSFFDSLDKNVSVFYEAAPGKELEILSKAISYFNMIGNFAGYKIRTGGIEPSSFPPAEKIARSLSVCSENETPMKCTAGLHHPFRHYDASVGTRMHGFINVFCAGIFAFNLDLNEHELTRMLLEEDPYKFKFSDNKISYEGFEVFEEEIAEAREKYILSFGSCSFEEPVEDLHKLKYL
ncbi:MAG: hypothetical protein ACHQJ4_01310 [Ignavibacteria bacterium]